MLTAWNIADATVERGHDFSNRLAALIETTQVVGMILPQEVTVAVLDMESGALSLNIIRSCCRNGAISLLAGMSEAGVTSVCLPQAPRFYGNTTILPAIFPQQDSLEGGEYGKQRGENAHSG